MGYNRQQTSLFCCCGGDAGGSWIFCAGYGAGREAVDWLDWKTMDAVKQRLEMTEEEEDHGRIRAVW